MIHFKKSASGLGLASAVLIMAGAGMISGDLSAAHAGSKAKAAMKSDRGIEAFREICMGSAPTFGSALKLARIFYGIKSFQPLGDASVGMNADHSLSMQVSQNECAVTTPRQPGTAVRTQFLKTIAVSTGGAKSLPAAGQIASSKFVFQHDRKGGEAYVMVRK